MDTSTERGGASRPSAGSDQVVAPEDRVVVRSVQPPAQSAVHGRVPRGLQYVPHSQSYEGRFGRMFRKLPPLAGWSQLDLEALAKTMIDDGLDPEGENSSIPVGYTYLGQFIDHDITFDPASKLQRDNDPNALNNFRTPRYDLDSVYGRGPQDAPFMYAVDGMHMLIERHSSSGEDDCLRVSRLGTPPRGRAIIGDPRNDENIIVNQLHLAFIKFHNAVVDKLVEKQVGSVLTADEARARIPGDEREVIFDEARRITRWHYQWVVIHDFLRRLVGQEVVDDLFPEESYVVFSENGQARVEGKLRKVDLKFYKWKHQPFMPVEFSVAAYRFGHSMVRPFYRINQELVNFNAGDIPIFGLNAPGSDAAAVQERQALDQQTEDIASQAGLQLNPRSMEGFEERPGQWEINWARFFELDDTSALQASRKIDTKLALGLAGLPDSIAQKLPIALATLNLLRGVALGLPSGQNVAMAMGVPASHILNATNMGNLPAELSPELAARLGKEAPLWYYVLKEAEVFADGKRLGPVGGRIVAEVLVGLLAGDPGSYYNHHAQWEPETDFGAIVKNGEIHFTMPDLLRFAGVRIKD
jgi:hypothetical protein